MRIFFILLKEYPTKKSHVPEPGTRNVWNTLERHTRKLKQPGLGLAFLLVVCICILPFLRFSGKFRGVPTCPGVLSFSTYHAKLSVSFSETYLRSIMSLWKCLYTFVTDSVPNLKKEEIQQALGVFTVTTDYLTQRVSVQTRERAFDRYPNNHHKVFMKKGENETWPSFINRPRDDRFVYRLSHVSHLVIRQI